MKKEIDEIKCELYLTEVEKNTYSDLRIEHINEDLQNLPPLKESKVSLDAAYIYNDGEEIEVSAFIRNGTESSINYKIIPAVIKNEEGKIVASKVFSVKELGEIPEKSARPYKFIFEKKDIYVDEIDHSNWKIQFSSKITDFKKIILNIDKIPKSISGERLNNLYEKLIIKPGQMKLVPFEFGINDKGNPYVMIIINNGTKYVQSLSVIPLTVRDANQDVIIQGDFKINTGKIEALSSKLYTLVFEDKEIDFGKFDMSNFDIEFVGK